MNEDHDPLDLLGQERATAEYAEEERRQRQKELSDLCKVMSSKEGRRFMWRLLSGAGLFRSSFNADIALMSFNEGNRNVGLKQVSDIMEACPQHYATMQEEYRQAKEEDERRRNDRRTSRR